jgi:hypothetical protein
MDDTMLNPANLDEVAETLDAPGFDLCRDETFEPRLTFRNFDEFMEFGYRGGWPTPLLESMGPHKAGPLKHWVLNRIAFPVVDRHNIVIALGRKR